MNLDNIDWVGVIVSVNVAAFCAMLLEFYLNDTNN